jgi:hypothetical protein
MDAEVSAMNRITKMMSELSEKDRAFVVRWFVEKYGAAPAVATRAEHPALETTKR